MLKYFSFSNFFSFKNKCSLDLESYSDNISKTKLINGNDSLYNKVAIVVGHNASGKTTIFKALTFISWLMRDSFFLDKEENFPYSKFFYSKDPSQFVLKFSVNSIDYHYEVDLTSDSILREFLSANEDTLIDFNSTKNKLFINEKRLGINYTNRKSNCSLISLAINCSDLESEVKGIENYLSRWASNVNQRGKKKGDRSWDKFLKVSKWYYENPDLLKIANKVLSTMDNSLKLLDILKIPSLSNNKGEFDYIAYGYHLIGEQEEQLLLRDESYGTQTLFYLLYYVLPILKNGGLAILDEFDNELHPEMLPYLLNLFYNKRLNPLNAQLIFSSHHYEILHRLNNEQINFCHKNNLSVSHLKSINHIDKIEGVPHLLYKFYSKLIHSLQNR